jgi:anthranilate phosphoribosyltransferase
VLALEAVCAPLAALLALRGRLGVRNSAHTVAKMLQPLDGPCIQLLSVTHPDYLEAMRSYYATYPAQVLLMRGTEGEPVVHPRRAQRLEWLHDAQAEVLIDQGETAGATPLPEGLDAPATARWTEDVLAGRAPMPDSIRRQVEAVEKTLARLEPSAAAAERGHARGARP